MTDKNDIHKELKHIQEQMDQLIANQAKANEEMKMMFADISLFEEMMIRIVEGRRDISSWERTKIQ